MEKNNSFHHYFLDSEKNEDDFFKFTYYGENKNFVFNSSTDVFSKNNVDYGTNLLINTVLKEDLKGNCLDFGCGYGVIGIVLAEHFKGSFWTLVDINKTAVFLSQKNIKENGVENIKNVVCSNFLNGVDDNFDFIVTNPPIRAGKENLFGLITSAFEHLNENGVLYNVIKKKHGLDSFKKHLLSMFKSVEVLKKDKGYYILKSYK